MQISGAERSLGHAYIFFFSLFTINFHVEVTRVYFRSVPEACSSCPNLFSKNTSYVN